MFSVTPSFDASRAMFIHDPVEIFDTEEQCHKYLRTYHKQSKSASMALEWTTEDQLYLLLDDRKTIMQCNKANPALKYE